MQEGTWFPSLRFSSATFPSFALACAFSWKGGVGIALALLCGKAKGRRKERKEEARHSGKSVRWRALDFSLFLLFFSSRVLQGAVGLSTLCRAAGLNLTAARRAAGQRTGEQARPQASPWTTLTVHFPTLPSFFSSVLALRLFCPTFRNGRPPASWIRREQAQEGPCGRCRKSQRGGAEE